MAKLVRVGRRFLLPDGAAGASIRVSYPQPYATAAGIAGGMYFGRAVPVQGQWAEFRAPNSVDALTVYGGEVGDPVPPLVTLTVTPTSSAGKALAGAVPIVIRGHPRDTGGGVWDLSAIGEGSDILVTAAQRENLDAAINEARTYMAGLPQTVQTQVRTLTNDLFAPYASRLEATVAANVAQRENLDAAVNEARTYMSSLPLTVQAQVRTLTNDLFAPYADQLKAAAVAGVRGPAGPSAADLWRAAGGVGDDAAYLASNRGKDNYQLARDTGYAGTLSEYLASLRGPIGLTGPPGSSNTDTALPNLLLNGSVTTQVDDHSGLVVGGVVPGGMFSVPWGAGNLVIAAQPKFGAGKGFMLDMDNQNGTRRAVFYDEYGDQTVAVITQILLLSNANPFDAYISLLCKASGVAGQENGVYGQIDIPNQLLKLNCYVKGTNHVLRTPIPFACAQDTAYHMELAFTENWYAVMAWPVGTQRPERYMLQASNVTLLTGGGRIGALGRTGDLYLGPRTVKTGYKSITDAAVVEPRGTGGTPGNITVRNLATGTRTNLLPTDDLSLFDPPRLAFIDGLNRAIPANGTADVTALDFYVAGRAYCNAVPLSNGAFNMKEIPEPVPDGWPTPDVSNASTRYLLVGNCYSEAGRKYLRLRDLVVEHNPLAASAGSRLDIVAWDFADQLLASPPPITRLLQIAGARSAVIKHVAEGDTGAPAAIATSPLIKLLGGVNKRVAAIHTPFGASDFIRPTDLGVHNDGDYLMMYAIDSTEDNALPRIFFGGSGSEVAGTAGLIHAVTSLNGGLVARKITTSGRDLVSETDVGSLVGAGWSANEWWHMRVHTDLANKRVYARKWKDGTAEPSTWLLNGVAVPDLVAGVAGFSFRNGNNLVARFAWAPASTVATYA